MAGFRHFTSGRWAMLHLRARGFAPLTRDRSNLMVRKGVTTVMLIAGALLFFISRGVAFVRHGR
jgi:hypothetical protein